MGRVLHVFLYAPHELGEDFKEWLTVQSRRWPLAPLSMSAGASLTSVHLLSPRRQEGFAGVIPVTAHRSIASSRLRPSWGTSWSHSLESELRRLGSSDVCIIHGNGTAAARLALSAAERAARVVVFHGASTRIARDEAAAVSAGVALSRRSAEQVRARGVPAVFVHHPSVDATLFRPGTSRTRLGYIGRVEKAKGIDDIAPIMSALYDAGLCLPLDIVGTERRDSAGLRQALAPYDVTFHGLLAPHEVADRLRSWAVLLHPSHGEGFGIAVLEALRAGVPVVCVRGVLPAELESRPGVRAVERHELPSAALDAVTSSPAPPDNWVRTHQDAAEEWDRLAAFARPTARHVPPRRHDRWVTRARSLPLLRGVRIVRGYSREAARRTKLIRPRRPPHS